MIGSFDDLQMSQFWTSLKSSGDQLIDTFRIQCFDFQESQIFGLSDDVKYSFNIPKPIIALFAFFLGFAILRLTIDTEIFYWNQRLILTDLVKMFASQGNTTKDVMIWQNLKIFTKTSMGIAFNSASDLVVSLIIVFFPLSSTDLGFFLRFV